MNTSILINAVRDGKNVKKSVTNINPDQKNPALKTFAQMVNNLSNDSFVGANRIDVQSVDESAPEKTTPTFAAQGNWLFNGQFAYRVINYNGDAPRIFLQSDNGVGSVDWNGSAWQLTFIATVDDGSSHPNYDDIPFSITLYAPETDNYHAATLTLTHTAQN